MFDKEISHRLYWIFSALRHRHHLQENHSGQAMMTQATMMSILQIIILPEVSVG